MNISSLPDNVSLIATGLNKNRIAEQQGYSQVLNVKSSIALSPVFVGEGPNSQPDIFGMVSIIVDPKIPMVYVSCSGFLRVDIPYAVEIKLADENIRCEPSASAESVNTRVRNISSGIDVRFFEFRS